MPVGFDFICENKECKVYKTRISLAGQWPLVEISELLKLERIRKQPDLVKGLESRIKEGRKYACASMPNLEKLEYKGTRVQMYCPIDKMIWDEDFEGLHYMDRLPEERKCRKCNGDLLTSDQAKNIGLNCPFCSEKMQAYTWFTNDFSK